MKVSTPFKDENRHWEVDLLKLTTQGGREPEITTKFLPPRSQNLGNVTNLFSAKLPTKSVKWEGFSKAYIIFSLWIFTQREKKPVIKKLKTDVRKICLQKHKPRMGAKQYPGAGSAASSLAVPAPFHPGWATTGKRCSLLYFLFISSFCDLSPLTVLRLTCLPSAPPKGGDHFSSPTAGAPGTTPTFL